MSEEEPKSRRIIPSLSIESGALAVRLREVPVGEVVSYLDLSRVIGKSAQKHRSSLDTARRIVLRDDRIIFEAVVNVGLKRLGAEEAAASMPTHVKRTRNAARKGMNKARAIRIEEVPQAARGALIASASYLALVDHAGAPASQKRLNETIQSQGVTQFLPMQRALEALKAK